MRRREFITLLGGAAAAWPLAPRAQQAQRMLQDWRVSLEDFDLWEREHHKDSIVQAALRRTAAQLLAQPLQVSNADRQLFKAIEHYNEAREKRRTVKSEITPRGVK